MVIEVKINLKTMMVVISIMRFSHINHNKVFFFKFLLCVFNFFVSYVNVFA
jgi:hypothetical protein